MIGGCTGETGAAPSESTPTTPAPVETRTSPTPTGTASQDEPSMEPSSEPIATRPPAPDPPERPAAMDGTDALAAIETAEYFLDALNYGIKSGDTGPLVAVSASECESCSSFAESIKAREEKGQWQAGGTLRYEEATIPEDYASLTTIPVQFETHQVEIVLYSKDNRELTRQPSKDTYLHVDVTIEGSKWVVESLRKVS